MNDPIVYSLDPAEIECSGPWLLHDSTPVANIVPSFAKRGQLVPVLLVKDGEKTLLVAGRARVAAARELGRKVTGIYIDAPDDISRAVAHLEENSSRTADECVKSNTFRFFAERMEKADMAKTLGALFGISPNSREMTFRLDWLDLEPVFDTLLAAGNIPLPAVAVLGRMSAGDRAAVLPFFEKIGWSRSNAVNFLTWLYETARREGQTVSGLIESSGLAPATEGESPKDAVSRLCRAARMLRYPHLVELECAHAKLVSEICAGTRWKVEPSGIFETGEVVMQTRFKSREMMRKAVADLETIEKFAGWEDIFDLGRDK
ncbi:ParB N-terminal domain-containing protein [Maridesulfovibrio sp.]|uniref:ParB N-terminal domain-containing protein n=1 Tax=Maridesulfovibrio sp. TaxID=2795000 RepID=UPI002A18936A|nr:ParB N-terminal domain-containing protein [Maridesulfovibrio sp.]